MATPHHLPKKRGSLKKHPKISFLRAPNFPVSHSATKQPPLWAGGMQVSLWWVVNYHKASTLAVWD